VDWKARFDLAPKPGALQRGDISSLEIRFPIVDSGIAFRNGVEFPRHQTGDDG
jgi:hypothetical protein